MKKTILTASLALGLIGITGAIAQANNSEVETIYQRAKSCSIDPSVSNMGHLSPLNITSKVVCNKPAPAGFRPVTREIVALAVNAAGAQKVSFGLSLLGV